MCSIPALLRPGRFDRQVMLDRPDIQGRRSILDVHTRGKPMEENVSIESLARQTSGFSGADLENLVNEAAILAARRNKKSVGRSELTEAIDRVIAGPQRKSRVISERERLMTAYHEAGHALVARMLAHSDPVRKVSIVARGMAGGYTRTVPDEDRMFKTQAQFRDDIAVFMAGQVAEQLVFEEISTGASNDIERATNIARRMVTEFGMSSLGPLAYGKKDEMVFLGREISEQRNYSDQVAFKIDEEVRRIIDEAHERATQVIDGSLRPAGSDRVAADPRGNDRRRAAGEAVRFATAAADAGRPAHGTPLGAGAAGARREAGPGAAGAARSRTAGSSANSGRSQSAISVGCQQRTGRSNATGPCSFALDQADAVAIGIADVGDEGAADVLDRAWVGRPSVRAWCDCCVEVVGGEHHAWAGVIGWIPERVVVAVEDDPGRTRHRQVADQPLVRDVA